MCACVRVNKCTCSLRITSYVELYGTCTVKTTYPVGGKETRPRPVKSSPLSSRGYTGDTPWEKTTHKDLVYAIHNNFFRSMI